MKTSMSSNALKNGLRVLQLLGLLLIAACAAPPTTESSKIEIPVFPSPPDEARFIYERTLYSSADVAKEDKNADLRRMLTGEPRSGEGLGKPYGVAAYKGRVYVSDTAQRSVVVFDIPGQRFFKIGEDENDLRGKLAVPIGLDVDGAGNLYVVDAGSKNVKVYDPDGKFLRSLAKDADFSRPSGIAVDAAGTRIYVVDIGGVSSDEHKVRVFDAQTGTHILDIGKRGTAPGDLNLPRDVSIGSDGLLYVVDGGNFRVQVYQPDGKFLRVFGGIGRQGGQFSRPKEVAIGPDGNVYVVDAAFGNFQIFNPEGQLLLSVGSRSERDGMAKYMLPAGIAIDGDGRVYMADQFFRKVDVYRPAKMGADEGFVVKPQLNSNK
jgi:sugar lactone lactonase YvrE